MDNNTELMDTDDKLDNVGTVVTESEKSGKLLRPTSRRRKTTTPRQMKVNTERDNVTEMQSVLKDGIDSDDYEASNNKVDHDEDTSITNPFCWNTCTECGKQFEHRSSLRRHMNVHSGNIVCDLCNKIFDANFALRTHKKNVHKLEDVARKVSVPSTPSLETRYGPFTGKCTECNKTFMHERSWKNHMAVHDGLYKCSTCNKSLSSAWSLRTHENIHKGIKDECNCGVCGKTFSDLSSRNKHVKSIHMGETNFNCTYCDKGFYLKKTFDEHIRVHTGDRPYCCELCKKSFKRISEYNHHMRFHKGEVSHTCEVCGDGFRRGSELKRHFQTKHEKAGTPELDCLWCDRYFMTKQGLREHVKRHHENEDQSADVRLIKQSRKMQFPLDQDSYDYTMHDSTYLYDCGNLQQSTSNEMCGSDKINDHSLNLLIATASEAQFTDSQSVSQAGNTQQTHAAVSEKKINAQNNSDSTHTDQHMLKQADGTHMTGLIKDTSMKKACFLKSEPTETEDLFVAHSASTSGDVNHLHDEHSSSNFLAGNRIVRMFDNGNESKSEIISTENNDTEEFTKIDKDDEAHATINQESLDYSSDATDVGYDYSIAGGATVETNAMYPDSCNAEISVAKQRIKEEPAEQYVAEFGTTGTVSDDEGNGSDYEHRKDERKALKKKKKSKLISSTMKDRKKKHKTTSRQGKMASKSYKRPFACAECKKRFQNELNLKLHLNFEHETKVDDDDITTGIPKCQKCDRTFVSVQSLIKHMDAHTEKHKCDTCNKILNSSWSLKNHIRTHLGTSTREWPCETCGKTYCDKSSLNKHIKSIHLMERNFFCEYCSLAFYARKTYDEHVRTHTGDRPYTCDTCGLTFKRKSEMTCHVKKHQGDAFKHTCPECGKLFMRLAQLKDHARSHSDERPYQCPWCTKRFKHRTDFGYHKNTHTHDKVYIAECCGTQFFNRKRMKTHLKSKTPCSATTSNRCRYCFVQCFNSVSLEEHIVSVHGDTNEERQYLCVVCKKKFRGARNLKKHSLIHSNERRYGCPDCGKTFIQSAHLKAHRRTHSGERPYSCEYCSKTFATAATLFNHVRNIHDHRPKTKRNGGNLQKDRHVDDNSITQRAIHMSDHSLKECDMHLQFKSHSPSSDENEIYEEMQSVDSIIYSNETDVEIQRPASTTSESDTHMHITESDILSDVNSHVPGADDNEPEVVIQTLDHVVSEKAVITQRHTINIATTVSGDKVYTEFKYSDGSQDYRDSGSNITGPYSRGPSDESYTEVMQYNEKSVAMQSEMGNMNFTHSSIDTHELQCLPSMQVHGELSSVEATEYANNLAASQTYSLVNAVGNAR